MHADLSPDALRRWLHHLEVHAHDLTLEEWAYLLRQAFPNVYAEPPADRTAAQVCGTEARVEAMAARGGACLCGRCVLDDDLTWRERHCWGYSLWNEQDLFRREDLDGLAVEVKRGLNGAILEQGVRNA